MIRKLIFLAVLLILSTKGLQAQSTTDNGPFTIWSASTVPAIITDPDASAIELGVKFRPLIDGYITGIRYYKSETNTGLHTGNLWSLNGDNLARATFTDETNSGWQQVLFSAPVAVTAGTTYVASYHTTAGHYSFDANYFNSATVTPYLEALAAGVDGPNGVYALSASTTFPTAAAFNSGNVWVDVVFRTALTDETAPSVLSTTPVDAAIDVSTTASISVKFSEAIDPASINDGTLEMRNAANESVATEISYNPEDFTATLTPSEALANSSVYTVTVKGGSGVPHISDAAGNSLLTDYSWSFTTVAVVKATQNVTFDPLSSKTFGDEPFAVSATSSSGLPVTLVITDGPATINQNTITITGAGQVTVTASQAGNDTFDPAAPVSQSFTVAKAEQVIVWTNPNGIIAGTPLSATQLNAQAPGALTYSPVVGTVLPVGTHTLSVTAAATDNYNEAIKTVSIVVTSDSQTITFAALSNKTFGDEPFTVSATASSNLPVSFSVEGPATINANTITITGAGQVTVTASQAGNDTFDPAAPVSQTFTVAKAEQVIVWTNPNGIIAGTPLSATQLNAEAPGALTYSPVAGTVLPAGTHTLSVTAAATDNYNEATKTVSIVVTSDSQTITFAALSNKTYGDEPFTVSATASSNLPVSFSVEGPATINANTITITGAGEVTVTASQAGNDTFDPAVPVSRTFTVAKAEQVIVWANPADITTGTPLSATQLNASVTGVTNGSAPGALTYNPASGTVLTAGTHTLSVTATSTVNYNAATKTTVITVNPAPPGQQVTSFTLINASTDQPIRTIANGETLNLATLGGTQFNIRANTSPTVVGRVVFALSGTVVRNVTEIGAPYSLFGDNSGNYNNWLMPVGNYTLKATPYTAATGGTAGNFLQISFSVINESTNQIPTANAGTDKSITLPTSSVQLTGSGSDPENGTNVTFAWTQVSGPNTAIFSNSTSATPTVSGLSAGTYVFQLISRDQQLASSSPDQVTVIVNPAPIGQQVTSFTLINAVTDQPIRTIVNGETLNLATIGTQLNIRANTSPATVGRVVFALSGTVVRNVTETGAPYSLFGDNAGNYNVWSTPVGSYTLKATPYTAATGGTAGNFLQISFSVINGSTNQIPTANAGTDKSITLPTSSVQLTGSGSDPENGTNVTFAWTQVSGPNTAIFSNSTSATPTVSGLSAGTYVFQLISRDQQLASSSPDQVTVIVNPAPIGQQVTSFTLINAVTDQPIRTIVNGETLNLATIGTQLNIRANTSPATVGRVVFALSGTVVRNVTETGAPYSLFGDNAGNYNIWSTPVGNYTLKATPYTTATGGTAGNFLQISFSVINSPPAMARTQAINPTAIDEGLKALYPGVEKITLSAYPNPFGKQAVVTFTTPTDEQNIILDVYDLKGSRVKRLYEGKAFANRTMKLQFDGSNLSAGMYFLRLSTPKNVENFKMIMTE